MRINRACPELPREILNGRTRLIWGPWDRLRLLKIVGKKPKIEKNQNKTSIDKVIGPLRDSQVPSWHFGPQTDVPLEPTSHRH